MTRPDQYSYIGGSRAAAIMGYDPHTSPLDVFLEYTGLYREDRPTTPAMEWGLSLESWVADQFCQRHDHTVEQAKFETHPEYPFIAGHADFYLTDSAELLETKTTTTERYDVALPPYVLWQCQHYMLVHGCSVCHVYVAVLHRTEFIYYRVEADAAMQEAMIQQYLEFWECVATGTPPTPKTTQDFGRMYSEPNDLVALATSAQKETLRKLIFVKSEIERLEDQKRLLDEELKWSLGNYQRVEFPDHVVTWTPCRNKRFNAGLFKETHPDLHSQFVEETKYRRFQIRTKKRAS